MASFRVLINEEMLAPTRREEAEENVACTLEGAESSLADTLMHTRPATKRKAPGPTSKPATLFTLRKKLCRVLLSRRPLRSTNSGNWPSMSPPRCICQKDNAE
ncbi:hypothetical protein XENTR_v10019127 [Xenopus tropicalis]|nr:hypothetical protein XENTR_v10019127 [Xenopus tropicalis]